MAITVRMFLCAEFVGAAALALWTVAVFPRFGPRTARSALAAVVCAFVVLQLLPAGVDLTMPYGAYATLFGCVLPGLYLVFLLAGWTMRHFAALLGGGPGGGPGHRRPAHARR